MTLRDLGRFALMLQNDGEYLGRQIVPKAVIEKIQTGPEAALRWDGLIDHEQRSYKSQWWLIHNGSETIMMAIGVYGQSIFIDSKNAIVIVTQSSFPFPFISENVAENMTMFRETVARVLNEH